MKEFITNRDKKGYGIRYLDLPGEKEPIIMIAGWGCCGSFDFPEVVSQGGLEEHRRILVDLLGSGFSDKPDDFDYLPESHGEYLYKLVEELKLENVLVYGHSMGGRVATYLAEKLEENLLGLILCEGSMKQERFPYMRESEEEYINSNFNKLMDRLDIMEDRTFYSTANLWTPISMYRSALGMMRADSNKWAEKFFKGNYNKVFIYGTETEDNGFDIEEIRNQGIEIIAVEKGVHTMGWDIPKETSQSIKEAIAYIKTR